MNNQGKIEVPRLVAHTENLARRLLRLEHGANVFPLAHVGLYYAFLLSLTVPGLLTATWLRGLCWVLLTLLNFSLTVGVMHMHCHRRLFTVRWLNRLLDVLMCLPSLLTASEMLLYHVHAHHKYENGIGDPSSTFGAEKGLRALGYWLAYPSRCKWYTLRAIFGRKAQEKWRRQRLHMLVDLSLCLCVLAFLAWIDPRNILFVWFPSLLVAHLNTGYFAWLTHAPVMPAGGPPDSLATVSNLMGFLVHNQGYHHVHHRYPGIHWTEIPSRLDDMLQVEPQKIVPYWVTLQSCWRLGRPARFFDHCFGEDWQRRYLARRQSGRVRLRWLPYFAWK